MEPTSSKNSSQLSGVWFPAVEIFRIIPRVFAGAGVLPLLSVVCPTSHKIIFAVAMAIKSIIALFLGLVIQLSQVQLGPAAEPVKSCDNGQFMSCCDGLQSCPCAKESDPDQKPSPLIPAGVDLKWLVSKVSEPASLDSPTNPQSETLVVFAASQTDTRCAFEGVPLSVAFCRFVI
ncbi:hypothetical protein JIN84_17325 [Luteolibacter yonseiensis]|uniref:Uncharacterized protein n=1 Tax=Luteolibacter yonseiensis TaxID=1144680 RepID=A0A934VCQ2_9BACT|nr:hypothetical protein [Luteolibacter yonseiensis]MBK1817385.1 hypothetical protein [Luteolibacter yonseiensis]